MRSSFTQDGGRLLGSTDIWTQNQWSHLNERNIPSSIVAAKTSESSTTFSEIDLEKDSNRPKASKLVRWRDLPNKGQLLILALCRLSEPLSNVCLLPYIFYLVRSVLDPVGHSAHTTAASTNTNTNNTLFFASAPGHTPTTTTTQGHYDTIPNSPVFSGGPAAEDAAALASRISLISGLLVAVFPLAQMFVSLPWGLLSDKHGRRPSILLGLVLTVVANACFGFSRSLGGLFAWRAVAGAANGNVALMRTMTAETVRERRFQTRAFLLLPLVFNSGMVVSLAVGGLLADPKKAFPSGFGPGGVFEDLADWVDRHPYALPSLMNTVVLGLVLVMSTLGLKETLAGKEADEDWGLRCGRVIVAMGKRLVFTLLGRSEGYQPLRGEDEMAIVMGGDEEKLGENENNEPLSPTPSSPSSSTPPSPAMLSPPSPGPMEKKGKAGSIRSLLTPKLKGALVSFALLPLHNNAFMHLFPLYLSTPPSTTTASGLSWSGGLGLPSSTIGPWLSVFGIAGILLQLFVYPRLQARLGTLGLLRVATLTFPVTYMIVPLLSLLPTQGPVQYALLALVSAGQILARTIAIPSTVILLTEAAPEKRVLGTVHGAGNTAAAFARAVGPALGGVVYAAGVRIGVIGLVWWLYLAVVSILASGWTYGYQKAERKDELEG